MKPRITLALLGITNLFACGSGDPSGGEGATILVEGSLGHMLRGDAENVYYADDPVSAQFNTTRIMALPKDQSGPPRPIFVAENPDGGVPNPYSSVSAFQVLDGFVYACAESTSLGHGDLIKVSTTDGSLEVLGPFAPDVKRCSDVALDGTTIFALVQIGSNLSIHAAPRSGGAPIPPIPGFVSSGPAIVADGAGLYYVDSANDGNNPFLKVLKQMTSSGSTRVVVSDVSADRGQPPLAIGGGVIATILDGTHIAAFTTAGEPLLRINNAEGSVSLATDGPTVYWSRLRITDGTGSIGQQPGTIWKSSTAVDSKPVQVIEGVIFPVGLLLDESFLYFIDDVPDRTKAAVYRLAR
jgi:hypothetical protein